MGYSKQIANTLISHMEEQEYHYEFDQEKGIIRMRFKLKSKLDHIRFVIKIEDCFYVSYGCIDMAADEEQRKEVAEFITRANFGLNFGNFELDMRDGEIRYKHAVDCDHCTLSSQMIETSLNITIAMYERYGNELLKVMFGMASAEEAVRIAEGEK